MSKEKNDPKDRNDPFAGYQELGKNNDLIRSIFDSTFNGIIVVKALRNEHGEIIDFEYVLTNKVAVQYFGRELIGKTYLELFPAHRQNGQFETYKKVIESSISVDREHFYEGEGYNNWLRTTAVKLGDGLVIGFDDITDRKKAEDRIHDFNKLLVSKNRELASLNSELKTFTSIAANDYNETLRLLYLSLEYIASHDGPNLSHSGRANIRRAQAAVQKMKLLTDDLVSYSKLHEVGVWEQKVDLNTLLVELLADFEKKSALLDAEIECLPLPYISGYPSLISLLFHHLVDNAIRYRKSEQKAMVKISCRESVPASSIEHSSVRADISYHIISVTDNGIGFPKEEAENIFGMFYRLDTKRHKGSGIGLAVCRKIMDMHEGFIIAESQPGEGSAFHCFFPFEAREKPPEKEE